ncbi:hypothetical protein NP233_g2209 [Leucocoprinus birnbaumii]|uniref:Nephrocystin 3-like N-terminal domain-containing protein n=1 Tax=Leucocoprinus birnbaumii TaxID=56174 RepID=A0AAD5W4T5_9AGAR|nr:hypothetical protein NP233_g2209 [Leucocoprinus birnbaumii]
MGLDSLIDTLRLSRHFIGSRNRRKNRSLGSNQAAEGSGSARPCIQESSGHRTPPPGFFAQASNVVINNPIMTETITNNFDMFANGNAALQRLAPHTDPDAAADSSARWPPPSCHPGTRITIGNTLMNWLSNPGRQWNFIWLYGSAGCGKSAVAQTFADKCVDLERLGAAFFFSRPNKRNDPKTVVPSLAYQLATHCPEYKTIITSRLADDPQLLSKAIPVQFRKLIIEPFTYLQHQHQEAVRQPFLILLDGLDECQGEVPHRPEAHLQHIFFRIPDCDRIELIIDKECQDDVDRYLRDGLFDLQTKYNLDPSWPSADKFKIISSSGSGYFVFAATALGFIGDEEYADPVQRLDQLVAFLECIDVDIATNPLAKLDFLYTCILSDIPDHLYPITRRILAHFSYSREVTNHAMSDVLNKSAQALCNWVNIDQNMFYGSLRKLYSLIDVPAPEKAATTPLRFYHASFQDFLVNETRSGRFFIEKEKALVDITKTLIFWHEIDGRHFHVTETIFGRSHDHASLPGLKWASGADAQHIPAEIAGFAEGWCWTTSLQAVDVDPGLLSFVLELDLRYLKLDLGWMHFVNKQREKFPVGFCRTELLDEFDAQLLEYMKTMTNQVISPAAFPLTWDRFHEPGFKEYLLVGFKSKSVVVIYSEDSGSGTKYRIDRFSCDQPPSPDKITEYQSWKEEVPELRNVE